jgi:hypothetical protein
MRWVGKDDMLELRIGRRWVGKEECLSSRLDEEGRKGGMPELRIGMRWVGKDGILELRIEMSWVGEKCMQGVLNKGRREESREWESLGL